MRIINTHKQDLNNLLSRIITEVALSFPIKLICEISFYSGNKLVATCSWQHSRYRMQLMYQLQESIESSFVLFDSIHHHQPTQAKITGMDFDDFPFSLYVSTKYLASKPVFD